MKDFIRKNMKVIIILIVIIVLSIIGITLAYSMNDISITLASGEYNVVYSGTATLPTSKLQPIYDSELQNSSNASKIMKIDFTVKGAETNPTDIPIIYDVSLTNLDLPEELHSQYLKWRLYKNGTQISEGNFSKEFDSQINNRMVLTNIQQDLPSYSSSADSYVFYIWISEACTGDITTCTEDMDLSPLLNKTFSGEIRIELSTKGKKQLKRYTGKGATTLGNLNGINEVKETTPDFSVASPIVLTYKENLGNLGSSSINQTSNTYYVTYASEYEFNKETGKYTLVDPVVAKYEDVYTSLEGKYIVSTRLSTSSSLAGYTNLRTIYYVVSATYDGEASLGVIEYNENTSKADELDESDTGIFTAEDDLGISYYYRGNVENNYVYFADYYWRIIRINGDGTIRIIYDGTSAHENGESSVDRVFVKQSFSTACVANACAGYMFGDGNATTYAETHANITDSAMKNYLENTWYKTYILDKGYDVYIADAIYCNDRSLASGTGVGTTTDTSYAFNARYDGNPTLKCPQENDKFTINKDIGNGNLKYPIGLITVDELVFAGTTIGSYLYTGYSYWSMTPSTYDVSYGFLNFWYYNGSFIGLHSNGPGNAHYARPVISLKSDAITGGTGTMNNPYTVG